jgi:hypothetical protein
MGRHCFVKQAQELQLWKLAIIGGELKRYQVEGRRKEQKSEQSLNQTLTIISQYSGSRSRTGFLGLMCF